MNSSGLPGKYLLQRVAHEAMLQHGLLPDFSGDVLAQAEKIATACPDLSESGFPRSAD
jgi:hypothetical protein